MAILSRRLAKHIQRAITRRFFRPAHDFLPELLVCSPGGVATTVLMRHLKHFKTINNPGDSDGFKHPPRPPRNYKKILYVSGNPEKIFLSISRRGWLQSQSSKLGSLAGVLLRGKCQEIAFKRAVMKQERLFNPDDNEPGILIVHYDDIWDRVPEIAEFAGIDDPKFIAEFPPRIRRLSAPS